MSKLLFHRAGVGNYGTRPPNMSHDGSPEAAAFAQLVPSARNVEYHRGTPAPQAKRRAERTRPARATARNAGKCTVCQCSQFDACTNGCGWAEDLPGGLPICTNCAEVVRQMRDYLDVAHTFRPAVIIRLARQQSA